MIKSAKSALANHFGWELSEVKDYEYHAGSYTKPVYALSNSYYCASKDEKRLPKPFSENDGKFDWIEVKDDFINQFGWKIFKASTEI